MKVLCSSMSGVRRAVTSAWATMAEFPGPISPVTVEGTEMEHKGSQRVHRWLGVGCLPSASAYKSLLTAPSPLPPGLEGHFQHLSRAPWPCSETLSPGRVSYCPQAPHDPCLASEATQGPGCFSEKLREDILAAAKWHPFYLRQNSCPVAPKLYT